MGAESVLKPVETRGGVRGRLREIGPELVGFAVAGACAYAADLGLFVWLRGPVGMDPISAKALSFVAGCSVAYLGNALGTYRKQVAEGSRLRQYGVFFVVNVAGALVQLVCIAVSHYVLGFTSPRADTVSGAGVGMALATVVRFWGTRTLAFGARAEERPGGETSDGERPDGERPVGEGPAGMGPPGMECVGVEPTGIEPVGVGPTGKGPAGRESVGMGSAGEGPAGEDPVGVRQVEPVDRGRLGSWTG